MSDITILISYGTVLHHIGTDMYLVVYLLMSLEYSLAALLELHCIILNQIHLICQYLILLKMILKIFDLKKGNRDQVVS